MPGFAHQWISLSLLEAAHENEWSAIEVRQLNVAKIIAELEADLVKAGLVSPRTKASEDPARPRNAFVPIAFIKTSRGNSPLCRVIAPKMPASRERRRAARAGPELFGCFQRFQLHRTQQEARRMVAETDDRLVVVQRALLARRPAVAAWSGGAMRRAAILNLLFRMRRCRRASHSA